MGRGGLLEGHPENYSQWIGSRGAVFDRVGRFLLAHLFLPGFVACIRFADDERTNLYSDFATKRMRRNYRKTHDSFALSHIFTDYAGFKAEEHRGL